MDTKPRGRGLLKSAASVLVTCAAVADAAAAAAERRNPPEDSAAVLQQLAEMQKQLKALHVEYVFRDFPLPMHAHARAAALAAHCAGRQDAFWPMHDALFASQQRLGPECSRRWRGT
jgi:protein-disulfide isomerase